MLSLRSAVVSLLTILAIGFAPFIAPPVAACPVAPPIPLRALYKDSRRIVVATFGGSVPIEVEENYALLRTALNVSATLKGDEHEPVVYLYHYQSGPDESQREAARNEPALFFLVPDEQEGQEAGYRLIDERYGLKRLSAAELKIYVQRIEELAAILAPAQPDVHELAEWLVRCVAEPATRWEGAYDLLMSARAAEQASERARRRAPAASLAGAPVAETSSASETGAAGSGDDEAAAEPGAETTGAQDIVIQNGVLVQALFLDDFANANPEISASLTEEQRARILAALFGAEKVDEGELALVELVADWNDERLVPFLFAQLERIANEPPYIAEDLAMVLAHALRDEELVRRAQEYRSNAPYTSADMAEEAAPDSVLSAGDSSPAATRERSALLRNFMALAERKGAR